VKRNKGGSTKHEARLNLVDPTGLKPAPYGLKGRRSVTRAPGQQASFKFQVSSSKFDPNINLKLGTWNLKLIDLAVAEGFEPSLGRINSAVPYQLGYATEEGMKDEGWGMKENHNQVLAFHPSSFILWFGGDEGSRTLIDRFTRPTLCYPVELHRH
jgi:hypothetical protein